jgi:hypothetical protein
MNETGRAGSKTKGTRRGDICSIIWTSTDGQRHCSDGHSAAIDESFGYRCSIDIRAIDVLILKAISGPDTPGLDRPGPR